MAVHRGAFCQFPFWWIYYCHSCKYTGKGTGKMHLCAVCLTQTHICTFINANITQIFYCYFSGSNMNSKAFIVLFFTVVFIGVVCSTLPPLPTLPPNHIALVRGSEIGLTIIIPLIGALIMVAVFLPMQFMSDESARSNTG